MPPAAATAAGRAPKTRNDVIDDEIKVTRRTLTPAERVRSYGPSSLATEPAAQRVSAPRHTTVQQPRRASTQDPRKPRRESAAKAPSNRTAATAAAAAPRRVQPPAAPRPRRAEPSGTATTAATATTARRRPATEAAALQVSPRTRRARTRPAPRSFHISLPKPQLRPRALRLDRIVRGRAWIPVLGVMLFAVVGMRVEVLKMSTHVGAAVQEAAQLQSVGQGLQTEVAALEEPGRIERLGAKMHMHLPGPMDVKIVSEQSGRNVARAIAAIHKPSTAAFESNLASEESLNREEEAAVATGATATSASVSSVDASTTTTAAAG